MFFSKLKAHRDLSGAVTAKVRSAGGGDLPEDRIGDVKLRVVQVGVIQHIGKRAFRAQMNMVSDRKPFAQACLPIHRSRSHDIADTLVAESPDGV